MKNEKSKRFVHTTTVYFLELIVTFLVLAVIIYGLSYSMIRQRELDKMQYLLESKAAALSNYFQQTQSLVFDLATSSRVEQLLISDTRYYVSPRMQTTALEEIGGLNRFYQYNIMSLQVVSPDMERVLSVGNRQTSPYPMDDQFMGREEQTLWEYSGLTEYYTLSGQEYAILSYYRKVYRSGSFDCIGFIRLDVDVSYLELLLLEGVQASPIELHLVHNGERLIPFLDEIPPPSAEDLLRENISADFDLNGYLDSVLIMTQSVYLRRIILWLLAYTILLIGLSYRFILRVIRPIKRLHTAFQKTDPSTPAIELPIPDRNREIGSIYSSINSMSHSMEELSREAALTKTKYLQSQIDPHFLYNSLDSLRWLALKNRDRQLADEIYNLAKMFRYYLDIDDSLVPITSEIELIQAYMGVQKQRFHDKFHLKVVLDGPGIGEFCIPRLLLQPLVENAVLHAFSEMEENCEILLDIRMRHKKLYIRIWDNGMGIEKTLLAKINDPAHATASSYAISNIHKRLQLYYGNDASLRFRSRISHGTLVRMFLPIPNVK